VAGQEQRHGLVAHLAVRHPTAVFGILSLQQDREKVEPIPRTTAPIRDHAVNDLV
jgi:hypothetical protein